MSKYLDFVRMDNADKKTCCWQIVSKTSGGTLGLIRWFSRWRQYCFFPYDETVWNKDCLADIQVFIKTHKDDRQ